MYLNDETRDKPIHLTHHALVRCNEIGLTENEAVCMLYASKRSFKDLHRMRYKFMKYSDKNKNVEYYEIDNIMFTVCILPEVTKVITVTDLSKK